MRNKSHLDDFFWETRLGNKLQTLLLEVINRTHVPLTFHTVPHIPVSFVQVFCFDITLSWVGLFGLSSSCLRIGSHIGPAFSLQIPPELLDPSLIRFLSLFSFHMLMRNISSPKSVSVLLSIFSRFVKGMSCLGWEICIMINVL